MKDVVYESPLLSNIVRVGELTPGGEDTYTWVGEFDVERTGARSRASWEIELDGDLAARIEQFGDFVEIEPASDS